MSVFQSWYEYDFFGPMISLTLLSFIFWKELTKIENVAFMAEIHSYHLNRIVLKVIHFHYYYTVELFKYSKNFDNEIIPWILVLKVGLSGML